MRKFLTITAIGCSFTLIEAGSFKWNAGKGNNLDWTPALETPTAGFHQPLTAMDPVPTSPPELRRNDAKLAARRTTAEDPNVCGYIDGYADAGLVCPVDNSCLFTEIYTAWVAGCCPTTSLDCTIATTCVDSAVGESIFETSKIDDYTWWCFDDTYRYCATLSYGDVSEYSIMGCASTSASDYELIEYNAIDVTSDISITSPPISTTIVITTPGPTTPPPTPPTPTPTPKPTNSLGAIIGGAIGGVAVLTFFILGLVFLPRKKRNKKNQNASPDPHMSYVSAVGGAGDNGPQGPPPGNNYQYQQIQPVSMQQQYPSAGYADNIQKPPYNVQTHSYDPMASPTGSPLPQKQEAAPMYQASQNQQPQQTPGAHEMPAVKGDGNLNELA